MSKSGPGERFDRDISVRAELYERLERWTKERGLTAADVARFVIVRALDREGAPRCGLDS